MAKLNSNETFKFQGRYSLIAADFAGDAMQLLGVSKEQAIRFGNSFMADWGKVQKEWRQKDKEEDGVKLKISKPNADGAITATEIVTVKRVGKATPSISIAGVLQHFAPMRKAGVSYQGTTLKLINSLDSWLFQTGDWATTPTKEKEEVKTEAPTLEQVEA